VLRRQALLGRLHVLELFADFGEARLEFVERVVERLDLTGELVDVRGGISLLFLQGGLQASDGGGHFVDRVGILLDQVFHDAHALVEAALHGGHLLLELLDLSLQLDHLFAGARSRGDGQPKRGEQGENGGEAS
jgi:hypothetical protein